MQLDRTLLGRKDPDSPHRLPHAAAQQKKQAVRHRQCPLGGEAMMAQHRPRVSRHPQKREAFRLHNPPRIKCRPGMMSSVP